MASPNPRPEKRKRSHPHQHEIKPSQHQRQPNHLGWADLPYELVEMIVRRLPLEDCFGLVCKSWWSAMLIVSRLFRPPPVLILKPSIPCNQHFDDPRDRARAAVDTRFYAICAGGEHRNLPMFMPNPAARCCGSSMGWLFMADVNHESRVHLLNPLSGERVELPALPHCVTPCRTNDVLCSGSSSDREFTVAVKGTVVGRKFNTVLLTCRPKEHNTWRGIPYRRLVYTFALYERRLYVIATQEMVIYDLDPVPRKIGSVMIHDGIWKMWDRMLLAIMDGKLLLVVRRALVGTRRVYQFVINRWVKIWRLGEWALLMNQFTSQAFSTKGSPSLGFRPNCIYQPTSGSMVVYSMEDKSSLTVSFPRPETSSTIAGGLFQAYWFLAQSWKLPAKQRQKSENNELEPERPR